MPDFDDEPLLTRRALRLAALALGAMLAVAAAGGLLIWSLT